MKVIEGDERRRAGGVARRRTAEGCVGWAMRTMRVLAERAEEEFEMEAVRRRDGWTGREREWGEAPGRGRGAEERVIVEDHSATR